MALVLESLFVLENSILEVTTASGVDLILHLRVSLLMAQTLMTLGIQGGLVFVLILVEKGATTPYLLTISREATKPNL